MQSKRSLVICGLLAVAAVGETALANSDIPYITGSTLIHTWDFTGSQSAGWSLGRTTALTPGGVQLGASTPVLPDPGAMVGMMQIAAPSGLPFADTGVEMTFSIPAGSNAKGPPTDGYEFLAIWHNSPLDGFNLLALDLLGSGTAEQQHTGPNQGAPNGWNSGASLEGSHVLTLLLRGTGSMETYVDGALVGSRVVDNPGTAPDFISIGANVSGNMYMPFDSVVSQVQLFTVAPESTTSALMLGAVIGAGLLWRRRR